MFHERLARQVLLATPTRNRQEVEQEPGGVITSPTLLVPVLVWTEQNFLRLLLTAKVFRDLLGLLRLQPTSVEQRV